jgi:hypothetical protein
METGNPGVCEGFFLKRRACSETSNRGFPNNSTINLQGGMIMKNRNIPAWLDNNSLLIGLFLSAGLLVFIQSYVLGTYISPDSTNYLRAAQSLRDGYGLYVNAAAGDTETYFSIWPIGYPAMIALISLVTGTEIYLASKILSVIILACICGIFYCRFKKNAWIYALMVTNFGFLKIFWYTWSEQPFILGLIWISCALSDILTSKPIRLRHYISICFAALFLFFSRYIGSFSAGVIGLLAVYYFITGLSQGKKERIKKAILLIGVTFIVTIVMIGYLYTNILKSGYATGMERAPITEHPLELFMGLCISQVEEVQNVFYTFFTLSYGMVIVLCITVIIACFRFFSRYQGKAYISVQAFSFLVVGLLYWFSIVAMRFSADFDSFSYRLLFPASALFLAGITSIILNYQPAWIRKIDSGSSKYILLGVVVVSLFSHALYPLYREIRGHKGANGYRSIRTAIIRELSSVPPQSLIITSWDNKESYVNFIRPDIIMISPTWPLRIEQHASGIEKAERVYIYMDWERLPSREATFFSQYQESTHKRLIQIKAPGQASEWGINPP